MKQHKRSVDILLFSRCVERVQITDTVNDYNHLQLVHTSQLE